MTITRLFLGKRGAEFAVSVSPPGVDAETASADQLLLHITSSIPQLAMQGVVSPGFPKVVSHLLGFAPMVLPNLMSNKLMSGAFSYQRPFDNVYGPWTRSKVKCEASQLTFTQEYLAGVHGGTPTPLDINYFVYNKRLPS